MLKLTNYWAWNGLVMFRGQSRAINELVRRKSELIQFEWMKKKKKLRGRQKITLVEVVKNDMLIKE